MSFEAPSARTLTHRLVTRAAAHGDAYDAHDAPLAAEAACERTYREFSRSFGATGAHALLTRALAEAARTNSVLRDIRVGADGERKLYGVPDAIQAHGAEVVGSGLEAVLEALLELLGRLIGDDMVARLLEESAQVVTQLDEEVS